MAETSIQWTDYTFNPWVGCQRVSPGCEHCYAETYDKRVGGGVDPRDGVKKLRWGPTAPRVKTKTWKEPLKWNRKAEAEGVRKKVFCASLADVFEDRPELVEWRDQLWSLIASTPRLDWLMLTKRPENFARFLPWSTKYEHPSGQRTANPWPNVWLGTTVEDQRRANERIPHLVAVPAAVRFLSCEPLLEAVSVARWMPWVFREGVTANPDGSPFSLPAEGGGRGIDWAIIGGESGGGARPFEAEWARSLVKQCRAAGAAPFVKQMGANVIDRNDAGFNGDDDEGWHSAVEYGGDIRVEELDTVYQGAPVRVHLRDRAGGDMAEWPADLRVREFPEVGDA